MKHPEIILVWGRKSRSFAWIAAPESGPRRILAEVDRHRIQVNATEAREAGMGPCELADEVVDVWEQIERGDDLLALSTHRLVVEPGEPSRFERIAPAEETP